MAASNNLEVQPYDWVADDRDESCAIRIWGHNRDSERVLVRVNNYEPFCRIQLPSYVNRDKVEWNPAAMKAYANWLREVLKDDAPSRIQGGPMQKLYYYEETKYPFIVCYFKTKRALDHCLNLVGRKGHMIQNLGFIKVNVWETSVTTIHRMVTERQLKYGAWFRANAVQITDPDERISHNKLEYVCSYTDLTPIPLEESQSWITNPKIGSYDLECNSERIRAFPNMNYVSDAVFMISYISQRAHDHSTRKKTLLVVGDCKPIEGAEIRYFKHEIEAIDGLIDIIMEDDPTILMGYNTARFDNPYMDARMKIYFRDWKSCSLIKDVQGGIDTISWQSGAYGHVTISSLKAEGRLNIDMFPIIKRDHKLELYNLDFVSNKFLGRGKHPVKPEEMFRIYQGGLKTQGELKRCRKNLAKCEKDLQDNPELLALVNNIQANVPPDAAFYNLVNSEAIAAQVGRLDELQQQFVLQQQQVDDVEQIVQDLNELTKIAEFDDRINEYNRKLEELNAIRAMMVELDKDAENWAAEMGRVGAYCLEDSCLPIELFEETYTWIDLLETSTIVQVTVTEIFSRGQQIRVYNQIYSYAYHMGIVMDQRDGVRQKTAGGNVEDPMVGLMFFILLLDFASLYPSIIRAFNFCYTTLVPPGSNVPDEMCNIMAWSQTDSEGNVVHFRHRFIKAQYRKGILPQMCENLTNARAEVNGKRGPHNTPIVNIILNKRQLNLKFTNNSIFGFTGAQKLPCQEIFESITAMGRSLIKTTANHVREKHNGQIVYGDTDSIMVNLGLNDPYLADDMNTILSKEISALFPDPLRMEPETVFIVGLFIKKKKYMFIAITRIKLDHPDDTVEEIPFDDEYVIKDYKLYKVTTTANGKTTTKYVGIPAHVDITGRKVIKGMPLLAGGAPDPNALSKKGVMSARRDNVLWGREIFNKVTMNIMFMKSLQQTMGLIDDSIGQLMSRAVPFKSLKETRGIGANYKPNSRYPMKIFADELRLAGRPVEPGERIDFVFVKCTDPERNKKQGYRMRTPEMYWENYEKEPIDYPYYVQKTANAIEQIFYIGYKNEIDEIERKCQPEIRRRKRIYTYVTHTYVKNWVKMLRYKEEMVKFIRERTPHFPSQEPYFTESFVDEQDGPVIEIIEVPDYAPITDDYGMSDSESDSE